MVERPGEVTLPPHDLAARRVDGGVRTARFRAHAAVDLTPRVVVQVEPARLATHEAERPGDDGLRLEGLRVPRRGHLPGDDALHVRLEADVVDRGETPSLGTHPQQAPIAIAGEAEQRRAGIEADGDRPGLSSARLRSEPEGSARRRAVPAVRLTVRPFASRTVNAFPEPTDKEPALPASRTRTRPTPAVPSVVPG